MVSRSGKALAAAIPLGVLASGVLIWQASYAAFTGSTSNDNNTFSAGTVSLTDNRQGPPASVMFSPSNLKPGQSDYACIKVTYTGSVAASVKLYVASGDLTTTSSPSLAQYLTIKVDQGSGNNTNCSDFSPTPTNIYNTNGQGDPTSTLSAFSTASHDFGSGVGSFTPSGNGDSATYKITYWLQDTNAAQGKNATAKFTWEAQNT